MPKRPLGAQISHMLKARDVDTIFGIPGVHNVELYRGIEEAGITHVLARHEQGAGFMADGYARATGKPGVAYVITGPGLCNIMTPMGQAYSDSVPMLVVSSCLNKGDLGMGRGRLHEMKDQEIAAGTVCDWSNTAMDAESAYQLVDRAFGEFASERHTPKHIQVPIDVLGAVAEPAPEPRVAKTIAQCQEASSAVAAIRKAKKPMFVFGGGAKTATDSARTVMTQTGAAAFTTYAGRGILSKDEPLNYGSYLARPDSADVIGSADLVIAVGTTLSEVDLWRDNLGHTAKLIRVDIDSASLFDAQHADETVLSDAGAFLDNLLAEIDSPMSKGWKAEQVAKTRARWRAETDAERPGIVPLCDAIEAALPADTMYFSDMTQFAYVAKEVVDMDRPGHWHHPYGFGTLGYALPAAIGGKVGLGDQPVVAIMGDYGFHYTMQELGVAVELGLTLPIILWDNGKLKEIEDSMIRSQIAPNAVIAQNPDFCKLAEAFGALSAAPKSIEELQDAIRSALKADGPTLIYVTPEIHD